MEDICVRFIEGKKLHKNRELCGEPCIWQFLLHPVLRFVYIFYLGDLLGDLPGEDFRLDPLTVLPRKESG